MILPDYPIQSKEDDRLKRAHLAEKVADLICNFNGPESFVIGIEGVWGSGKTSFINILLSALEGKVSYFEFNPWNFSDQNSLIRDFFAAFSSATPVNENKELLKKMKGYVGKLDAMNINFLGIPGLGVSWGFSLKFPDQYLASVRQELDDSLISLNKKIVVVIDDIDRLDSDETRLIFKLVKMTANFPNTVFILAYDINKVKVMLTEEEDGIDGGEYLKKIVQVSFMLPEPDPQNLREILFEDLYRTVEEMDEAIRFDRQRWMNLFFAGIKDLFITIRDIKRFISSLRLGWSIVSKEDISSVDFVAIEVIRVFAPQFYSAMSMKKYLFTGADSEDDGLGLMDSSSKEEAYETLLGSVPEDIRLHINKICKQLFPPLAFNHSYSYDNRKAWRTEARVCSGEKFDFYFRLGIPSGAVSETEIQAILKTLGNQETFLESLRNINVEGKLSTVLYRLMDYLGEIEKDKVKNFILSLWQIVDEVEANPPDPWDFNSINLLVLKLSFHSIKERIDQDKQDGFIVQLTEESSVLYPTVYFASYLVHSERDHFDEEIFLGQKAVTKLKLFISSKVQDMVARGNLINQEFLPFWLFCLKEYVGEQAINSFISGLLGSKSDTSTFVAAFIVEAHAYEMGNRFPQKTTKHIDKSSIGGFYPIGTIEDTVNEFTDEDLRNLDNRQKEAIELFRGSGAI